MKFGPLAVGAALLAVITACGSGGQTAAGGGGGGKVGIDHPRADSDFCNSYIKYVPQMAGELKVDLMPATNSQNDVTKLVNNVQALIGQGAKAIVMAPQDTGAIATTLQTLANKK